MIVVTEDATEEELSPSARTGNSLAVRRSISIRRLIASTSFPISSRIRRQFTQPVWRASDDFAGNRWVCAAQQWFRWMPTIYDSGSTSTSTIHRPARAVLSLRTLEKAEQVIRIAALKRRAAAAGPTASKRLRAWRDTPAFYLDLSGADAVAKQNSSGGTTVCLAKAGANGVAGTPGQGDRPRLGLATRNIPAATVTAKRRHLRKGYGGGAAGPSGMAVRPRPRRRNERRIAGRRGRRHRREWE